MALARGGDRPEGRAGRRDRLCRASQFLEGAAVLKEGAMAGFGHRRDVI